MIFVVGVGAEVVEDLPQRRPGAVVRLARQFAQEVGRLPDDAAGMDDKTLPVCRRTDLGVDTTDVERYTAAHRGLRLRKWAVGTRSLLGT
jgi:hypothetical protein